MNVRSRIQSLALSLLLLSGLSVAQPSGPGADNRTTDTDVTVRLPSNSPKRSYIKEMTVSLRAKPTLEPLAGKVTYDETRTARVSSPVKGRVVSAVKSLGEFVRPGDELAVIDSPDLADAIADLKKAEANVRLSQKAYDRSKALYQGMAIARKDFEQTTDDLANARSEALRAREKLQSLNVEVRQRDERFVLRSPIAGSIIERNLLPGFEVRPDLDKPLFVLSDLSQVWVMMEVFEKDLALVQVGQEVAVSVPAYPEQRLVGKVDYIAQEVDEDTRTVKVRCLLPNPQMKLLPAMYATVELQSSSDRQAVVVPLSALFTEGESDWLFVKVGADQYRRRAVKVGLRLKDQAVIEAGLAANETIVSEGALALRAEEKISEDTKAGTNQDKAVP